MTSIRYIVAGCFLILAGYVAANLAKAADTPPDWRQTEAASAPEAVQAAAADESYFYAIANAVVAKYDRRNGQRLAISTGEATHLNSGLSGREDCCVPTRIIQKCRRRARSRF
jgi:hypothetical protein